MIDRDKKDTIEREVIKVEGKRVIGKEDKKVEGRKLDNEIII